MAETPQVAPETKGFLASLFDTHFETLITPRIVRVVYILIMIVVGLFALFFVAGAFSADTGFGIVTLFVLAPLGFLLYLTIARIWLELVIVLFRIRDAAERIASER